MLVLLSIHFYQLVMLYQADQIIIVSRCSVFNSIYHRYYNHYKYIEFCGLIFLLIIMYSCMQNLVNKGCAKCLKKSSHNSKFQRGLKKEFIHPTQMRAYIVQNYDINKSKSRLCMLVDNFKCQDNCCIQVAIPCRSCH